MYVPITNFSMIQWLRQQIMIVEAWREEVAMRSELDIQNVVRLEKHYAWLSAELGRLENQEAT